jgi:hypothetical protein
MQNSDRVHREMRMQTLRAWRWSRP